MEVNGESIKFLLEAFKAEILDSLSKSDLQNLILQYEPFNPAVRKELAEYVQEHNKTDVLNKVLKYIDEIKDDRGYTALADAFYKMDHQKIHLILTGTAFPTNDTHRKLIWKCGKEICSMLDVRTILPCLKDLISDEDRQIIHSALETNGPFQAAYKLLIVLPNRNKNWYQVFMQTLLRIKNEDLAYVINKELQKMYEAGEPTCVSMVVDSESCTKPFPHSSQQIVDGIVENTSTTEHILTDYMEAEPINDLDAPPPIPKRLDSLPESVSESLQDITRSNSQEYNIKPDLSKTLEFEKSIDDRWESDDQAHIVEENHSNSSKASIEENDTTDDDSENLSSDCDDSGGSKGEHELKLYDYQFELASHAVEGRNTIICAGTGSGKTYVALHVVREHLKEANQGHKKVAFMARTSALIKQQADRFKRFLPEYQTKLITGENEDSRNVRIFLEINDILCLTPQILVNNLDDKAIKSLSEFSLLILDECHHTIGDEPYSILMRKYLFEKMLDNNKSLPQIVGLTASVTIGKAQTDEDACDSIVQLFARLDCRVPSVVKKCTETYEKRISQASEECVPMIVPKIDPCKDILLDAMKNTERDLEDATLLIPSMIDVMTEKCPPNKQSQEYNKWTVDVVKMALRNVQDEHMMRNVVSCATHLNVYNAAFEVNSLLGPIDVIKFLAQRHEAESENIQKLTDEEKKLLNRLKDVQRRLRQHSKAENPNVRKLCDMLAGMMKKDLDNSRAMVFVKARATCLALGNFLKKEFDDQDIHAHYLYGKDQRGGLDGMTESVQNETVTKFRDGDYKILVATSVGVEGIDVPDCNIVLNYNFMGNEITKIQMKGRSRKKEGHTVIMGNAMIIERDRVNALKIALMQRALKLFLKMDDKIKGRKIASYQKKELDELRKKAELDSYKRGRKSVDKEFEIQCRRCNTHACFTSDVRNVKKQFIVIDPKFADKIELKPHKRPKMYDGFYKKHKMYCKKCPLDWGIVSENKGLPCRTLKLESFTLKDMQTGVKDVFKKWDDVPVEIQKIELEDIPKLFGNE